MPEPAAIIGREEHDEASRKKSAELLRRLHQKHVGGYQASARLEIRKGRFAARTPADWPELWRILQLRHDVFWAEQRERRRPFSVDVDEIDLHCDHLGVFDQVTGEVLGTYRLASSVHTSEFYSAKRFELGSLLAVPGNKLELGRACVRKDARGSSVLHLLWRGIVEYSRLTQSRYLFGVSSVPLTNPAKIARIVRSLEAEGFRHPFLRLETRPDWRVPDLEHHRSSRDTEELSEPEDVLPPIFRFYLKTGARVCGEPAWDVDMECTDFITVHDILETSERHHLKYVDPAAHS